MMIQQMLSENSACRQPIRGQRLGVCHSGALDTLDPLLLRGFFIFIFILFYFLFFILYTYSIFFSFFFLKYTVLGIEDRVQQMEDDSVNSLKDGASIGTWPKPKTEKGN